MQYPVTAEQPSWQTPEMGPFKLLRRTEDGDCVTEDFPADDAKYSIQHGGTLVVHQGGGSNWFAYPDGQWLRVVADSPPDVFPS